MRHPINSQKEIWKLVSLNEKKGDTIFTFDKIDSIFNSWLKKKPYHNLWGEATTSGMDHFPYGTLSIANMVLVVTNMWRTLDYDLFISIKTLSSPNAKIYISLIEMLNLEFEKDWTFIPRLINNNLIAIDLHINSKSENTNTL